LSFRQHRRKNRKTCGSQGVRLAQEKIAFDYFRFKSQAIFSYLTAKGFLLQKPNGFLPEKTKVLFYLQSALF
jgi:hypothetical protein